MMEHIIVGTCIIDEILQLTKHLLEENQAPGQWAANSRGRDLRVLHNDYTKTKLKARDNNCKAEALSKINF